MQDLPNDLMPILAQIGVVNAKGGAVLIDVNDTDPYKFFYPVIELSLFPCAVFAAALREYIPNFSEEDKSNLQRYIFSCAENILSLCEQMGGNSKKILCDRLSEYALACKNESLCGLSLYGQFGFDYDGLRCWTKDHQVKCAHILCDHIVYIKNFRELATFEDLERLKPIVETNSEQELRKLMKLFGELFTTSCAIFMTVRGALNGGRKIRWRAEGLCQYCGREFKKTLLGSKCPACKIKKDY